MKTLFIVVLFEFYPPLYHVLRATLLSPTLSSLCVAGRACLSRLTGDRGEKDLIKTTVTDSGYIFPLLESHKREKESGSVEEDRWLFLPMLAGEGLAGAVSDA